MTSCVYVGNFEGVPHSTENHVARALENIGVKVIRAQENRTMTWLDLASEPPDVDFILWTRTGWDWARMDWDENDIHALQMAMLWRAHRKGVPVVGFHLDRWWGLERENQIATEPFFQCDLVITADGGHHADWKQARVNHAWMPPAVSRDEAKIGAFSSEYASPVAFVGSWRAGYHHEWTHRPHLIEWLQAHYTGRLRLFPAAGQPAIRGRDLQDLYASTVVNVGDSCMVGNTGHYWSDRIPETLGRGGFLIHPTTPGLYDAFPALTTWPLGDWDQLRWVIDYYLENEEQRRASIHLNREHTLEHHTYEVRMQALLDLLSLS